MIDDFSIGLDLQVYTHGLSLSVGSPAYPSVQIHSVELNVVRLVIQNRV